MSWLKSDVKRTVPCDYCNQHSPVLYCRADSAKLCLFCDQHVHSANLLSRKHLRSQICDNCGTEPVSVRCATDNLVLCQECDWDAHGTCSVSATHHRTQIEGFSGCPSALELASLWGLDLGSKKPHELPPLIDNWTGCQDSVMPIDWWGYKSDGGGDGLSFQELVVPNERGMVCQGVKSGLVEYTVSKKQSPNCGKHKQVIHKQLMELLKRELMGHDGGGGADDGGGGGGGESTVPSTPKRSNWATNAEDIGVENAGGDAGVGGQQQQSMEHQTTPIMPLITLPTQVGLREDELLVGGDMVWNTNVSGQNTQVVFSF